MDWYSLYTRNSASSSSDSYHSSNSPIHDSPYQYQKELTTRNPPPGYRSTTLHSVRKLPVKKVKPKKLPIAPLPAVPPKVYKVDRVGFKDAVQKLTSLPEFQLTRLQEMAPPPLISLSPPHRPTTIYVEANKPLPRNWDNAAFMGELFENSCEALNPLDQFSLSPSSLEWYSVNLLNPGTLPSFDPYAIL